MSKVSSTDSSTTYPSYSGGTVSINGTPKATASYSNGSVTSDYKMNENEKAIYDYAQSTLASILPQLNTFSTDTQNSLQSQLDAYKSNGIETINEIYTPMIKSLENEVASRFGNLDNSIFMDNLGGIESKRSDAISSFAQDVLTQQTTLEDAELNRRYKYASFLDDVQNETLDNALSTISTALGTSSNANSYNSNLYNALYKQYLSNSTSSSSNISSLLSSALGLGSGTSSYL